MTERLITRVQLDGRVGDLSQVASCRAIRLTDGAEDGVRAIDVRVAGGIHALVLSDRGMDIGPAWYAGEQLAWQSPTGIVHPAHFRDDVWGRSFHGGLLFTAGLQNVGKPNVSEGESHGLHGRLSNLPARNVTAEVEEVDGRLAVVVRGEVHETNADGLHLVLRRTLTFPVGEPRILLHDEIRNAGGASAPLFVLYHVNPGYPVVDATSRVVGPATDVVGWDDDSRAAEAIQATFQPPTAGFTEQVFEHRLGADVPDRVTMAVVNPGYAPTGGIGVAVTFDRRQLPRLWHWRMLSRGVYVTGIEPANCGLLGRAVEREQGQVTELEPGASRAFDVEVRAAVGPGLATLTTDG